MYAFIIGQPVCLVYKEFYEIITGVNLTRGVSNLEF